MHAEGLVHRDIKPANIMRCADDHAAIASPADQAAAAAAAAAKGEAAYTYKLIDFGTALGVDERVARKASPIPRPRFGRKRAAASADPDFSLASAIGNCDPSPHPPRAIAFHPGSYEAAPCCGAGARRPCSPSGPTAAWAPAPRPT